MIRTIKQREKLQLPIVITTDEIPADRSWVTILIGENGTQKSYMLRQIAQFSTSRADLSLSNVLLVQGDVEKVVALSGTPLDRFPRASHRSPERPYVYFGMRSANNVVGTGQLSKSLVTSFLANRTQLKDRFPVLIDLFKQLKLHPRARMSVTVAGNTFFSTPFREKENFELSLEALENIKKAASLLKNSAKSTVLDKRDAAAANNLVKTEKGREELTAAIKEISDNKPLIYITTPTIDVQRTRLPVSVLRVLFLAGVIDIQISAFGADTDSGSRWSTKQVPVSHFSSGQWNWISLLVGLALEVVDDTLVLIDEPENSLHPSWQRDFIPHLLAVLKPYKRCHAIIATHSPLVATGLPPDCGNVRKMHRVINDNKEIEIFSTEMKSTFGWSATDAYEELFQLETTRASLFNETAREALELIRDKAGSVEKRREFASTLRAAYASLPVLDHMRHSMERIAKSLEDGPGNKWSEKNG